MKGEKKMADWFAAEFAQGIPSQIEELLGEGGKLTLRHAEHNVT